ncbi:MAG: WD40 repeat domain-containing protein [Planctomycetota bacterium]|nr:WD40 repeat domain-containing protein [Planctomycetota bacterium]MDA0917632.1 WD40 repeat domain-containing protein [Planctomycetota bacterium]MDA1158465.1 WD40 repeat domain-containing protein [Planctomycetota bacterium]
MKLIRQCAVLLLFSATGATAGDFRVLNEKLVKNGDDKGSNAVAFSPDGTIIVSSHHHPEQIPPQLRQGGFRRWSRLRVWDTESGEQLQVGELVPGFMQALEFLPDGRTLVASRCLSGGEVVFWSLADSERGSIWRKPKLLRELGIASDPPPQHIQSNFIATHLTLSPDGETLAASASYGSTGNTSAIRVWARSGDSQEFVSREAPDFFINSFCFSSDGRTLITHVAQQVPHRGTLVTGRDVSNLDSIVFQHAISDGPGLTTHCAGLAAIPGTSKVLFGTLNQIGIFDIASGKEVEQIDVGFDLPVRTIAVSNNGRLAAVFSMTAQGTVALVDLASQSVVAQKKVFGSRLRFSPDDRFLAISGQMVSLWDVAAYSGVDRLSRVQRSRVRLDAPP